MALDASVLQMASVGFLATSFAANRRAANPDEVIGECGKNGNECSHLMKGLAVCTNCPDEMQ